MNAADFTKLRRLLAKLDVARDVEARERAVRAISWLLKRNGKTWEDLAPRPKLSEPEPLAAAPEHKAPVIEPEWRRLAAALAKNRDLSPVERILIADMVAASRASERDRYRLRQIADRVGVVR